MMVLVVMVAVRHHPPHQGGHGVLNFADHHRRRRSITGTTATRLSERGPISRRHGPGRGSFQEERLFPPPRPHVTAAGEVAGCAGWARRGVFLIHVWQQTRAGGQAHTHARARSLSTKGRRSLARSFVCAQAAIRLLFFIWQQANDRASQAGDAPPDTHAHTRM